MIVHRRLCPHTDITWATPTSGFGHVADEQPLPYVHHGGQALTPMFGGEESQPACSPYTSGLPYGTLAGDWPASQQRFNWMRRPINLYWRNLFNTRSRLDKEFLYLHQLNFHTQRDGFDGRCPLVHFQRRFVLHEHAVEVHDAINFTSPVQFLQFVPICIPLFPDWSIGGAKLPRIDIADSVQLVAIGQQHSAAGKAVLWVEQLGPISYKAGDQVNRTYTYRWAPLP